MLVKFSIILILGVGGSLLLRFLLQGREPRFEHLSLMDIQRYVAYAANALDDDGRIVIFPENADGSVLIRKHKNTVHVRTLIMELSQWTWPEHVLTTLAQKLETSQIPHTLADTTREPVLTISFDPDDPLMPSSASHVLMMLCTIVGSSAPVLFTLYCWGPFRRGYVPEDGKIIAVPRAHTLGVMTGRFLGSLFPVRRLVDAIRFSINIVAYRRFQKVCSGSRKYIYFAYSEPHQWEYFLGQKGSLAPFADAVYCANWREHWEQWKRHPKHGRGTDFDRFVGHTWHITNMQRDLPFVIVFTKQFKPIPIFLNEVYAQRKRGVDAVHALRNREHELLKMITAQGLHATPSSQTIQSPDEGG